MYEGMQKGFYEKSKSKEWRFSIKKSPPPFRGQQNYVSEYGHVRYESFSENPTKSLLKTQPPYEFTGTRKVLKLFFVYKSERVILTLFLDL